MPLPTGWRFLTDEEARIEKAQGNPDVKNTITRDSDGSITTLDDPRLGKVDIGEDENALTSAAGFIGRQVAPAVLPLLAGRALGAGAGALASSALGAPVGEAGGVIPAVGTLGGMLVGAPLTGWAQEKILNRLAERSPSGNVAQLQRRREQDVRKHPYLSSLTSLLAAPAGGGGPGVSSALNAVKQAVLQGGLDVGTQMIRNKSIDPTKVNLGQAGISTLGGLVMSKPGVRQRAFERNVLPAGRFTEHFAPELPVTPVTSALNRPGIEAEATAAGANIPLVDQARMPIQLRPDWNPTEWTKFTEPELKAFKDNPFAKAVLRLKTELESKGLNLDEADINALAQGGERNYGPVSDQILLNKFRANLPERERLEQATTKNAEELQKIQNQQGQQAAIGKLTPEVSPVKSAAESAEVIAGRPGEVKGVNEEIKAFRGLEKQRDTLVKLISQSPEMTEDSGARDLLHNLDQNILQRREDLLRRGLGKLLYGEVESAPPPIPITPAEPKPIETTKPAEAVKPTPTPTPEGFQEIRDEQGNLVMRIKKKAVGEKQVPVPETAAAVEAQAGKLYRGVTDAVLVTPGEKMPEVPKGMVVTETAQGKVIHDPAKISPETVLSAAKEDKLGSILGHATETQPANAREAVVISNAAGQEVKGGAVTPETKAAETAALAKQAEPGEKLEVRPIEDVLKERVAGGSKQDLPRLSHDEFIKLAKEASSGSEEALQQLYERRNSDERVTAPFLEQVDRKFQKSLRSDPSNQSLGITPKGIFGKSLEELSKATRPGLSRIQARLGKLGQIFKKRAEQMRVEARQLIEPYQDEINQLEKGLNNKDVKAIDDYLEQRKYTGNSNVQLTPRQQQAVAGQDNIQRLTGIERSRSDSPLVREVVGGTVVPRPFKPKPNNFSEVPNKKFWDMALNGTEAQKDYARKTVTDHWMKWGGLTPEQANKIFNEVTTVASGNAPPNVEYAQLRQPEGIGMPKEFRMNWLDALKRQVTKQGMDLAWHRNIEAHPVLGPEMGYLDDGRGNIYSPGKNLLASDPDVRAFMKDYVGALDPGAQKFETFDRFIKTWLVQTPTQLWNIAQSGAPLGEVVRPRDILGIVKGIAGAIMPSKQREAIQRGSVRAGKNVNPAAAEDVGGFLNKLSSFVQNITLTEPLEKVHRTFYDIVGKEISQNRLKAGDTKFFDEMGPENWQSWNADKLVNYTTARLVERMAGGYSAEELPNFITRGSGSAWKPVFSLARWSIGRANHWIDGVYKPATQGNIAPLLGSMLGGVLSAGAVSWLKEELTNRKPRELTWEEFLKMPKDNNDLAYTLLSKANTAGYAGILGSAAFQVLAAKKGETPYGFQNPFIGAVTETGERLLQFANAVSNGDVEFGPGLAVLAQTIMQDRIQLARVLMEQKPDEGKREERIARRTGYLPPRGLDLGGHLTNPFGEAAAYRNEDADALRRKIDLKITRRQPIHGPTSAVGEYGGYKLLQQLQGQPDVYGTNDLYNDPVVAKRLAEDVEKQKRRVETFRRAVTR